MFGEARAFWTARWVEHLASANRIYLTRLNAALRTDFAQACREFGFDDEYLAKQVESLTPTQLSQLAQWLTAPFLRFDEQQALDLIVQRSPDHTDSYVHGGGGRYTVKDAQERRLSIWHKDEQGVRRWSRDQADIRAIYLTALHIALVDEHDRAFLGFGLSSRKFAQAVASLPIGSLYDLAKRLDDSFIRVRDTKQIQVLVERVRDGCDEIEARISVMSHMLSLRPDSPHVEVL